MLGYLELILFVVLASLREVWEYLEILKQLTGSHRKPMMQNVAGNFPRWLPKSPVPQSMLDPDQLPQELWSLSPFCDPGFCLWYLS